MSVNASNQTPTLRTNHVNNSLLKREQKNLIGRLLTNIIGRDGVWVRNKGNKIEVGLATPPFPWRKMSYSHSLNGDVVTINVGSIRMHGIAVYPNTVAATVTLTGSTEWVYLEVARGATTGTTPDVKHSATEPETTSTHLRIPLCKFTSTVAGTYTLERICSIGDINLDTPII
jgi:hypothetical protein